jgi:FtsP/CotA-like multicopper oxidase with cupredoxin domain
MLSANAPASTITVDEDDELFLTLTNTGMMMRPDLFDPHTVHFHGFPQAASVFDGVPDASIAINMGASLTYYYNVKDAGTYMYHCHVEATEHMQMGMLGNLYVRPRQNKCNALPDDASIPGTICPGTHNPGDKYAYNDGDGSTRYDVEYPIQIGSFDPNFHDASFSVQPLPFAAMRDKYFLLNGRGYPDTADPAIISWGMDSLIVDSQPVSSLITATAGDKILLRISNLNVTEFYTLATNGIPMNVVGLDARELVDDAGNKLHYMTNSVTLGGGQSADVILDTTGLAGKTFFLYTTNLDKLANNAENLGGMMTEIHIN